MNSTPILGIVIFLVVFVLVQQVWASKATPKGTKRLPGPDGLPLIGNLLQIPPYHSWLQFKAWADIFGPIYEISIAGRPHIMVSSEKIANDLLRERGNLYSSREQLPMGAQLLSDNLRPLLLPYNDAWRNGRKLMHALLNTAVVPSYEPVQLLESARVIYDLIRSPSDYERWFERYAAGLVLRLAYGKTVETGDEPHVTRILRVVHAVERIVSPGAYLVDTFPILMKLPKALAPFKREAAILHADELSLFREGIAEVRRKIAAGTAPPSFARSYLEKKDAYDLTDDEAAYVIGTLFEAGAGTTSAAMMSFTLAMVHHPQWQAKLQAEIDAVVGDSRLPNFDDIPNLPMVRAVVKETLRWRPVTAGGMPHQLIKDDVYEGYFIPAGANIHGVQWAIHRDPELYPDPETFNPARWLEKSYPTYREPLTTYPNLQNYSSFGFGRRICPGQNIAERSLNLLAARIGWACDIRKKLVDGKEVPVPLYDYTPGANTQPKPFTFDLKARSEGRLKIVDQTYEEERRNDPLR